jgi:hypothetical protein
MARAFTAALCLCLLPLAGCPDELDGNGIRARETRELDRFSTIESEGALDIAVVQGETYSAVVSIDSNLIDRVETIVDDDRLIIDMRRGFGDALPGPHVRLTVPRLHAAILSGSGSIVVSDFDQDEPLRLSLSGSGELLFSGSAPEVVAELDGSGDIGLAGVADHITLDLSGSGVIDAEELEAYTGDIELSGSGEVRATVRESARVALDGSGEIDLFGAPEVEVSKSGSGDVNVRP